MNDLNIFTPIEITSVKDNSSTHLISEMNTYTAGDSVNIRSGQIGVFIYEYQYGYSNRIGVKVMCNTGISSQTFIDSSTTYSGKYYFYSGTWGGRLSLCDKNNNTVIELQDETSSDAFGSTMTFDKNYITVNLSDSS